MNCNKINYIADLRYKSYACKRILENHPQNLVGRNYDIAVQRYKDILKETIKNPITTKLVMKEVLEEHPVENIHYYEQNKKNIEKNAEIKEMLSELVAREALYKNYNLREQLLEEKRIDLYKVNPKLTGLKKLALRFKLMF